MGGSVSQFAGMGRLAGSLQVQAPPFQVDVSPLVQSKAAAALSQSTYTNRMIVIEETDDDDGT